MTTRYAVYGQTFRVVLSEASRVTCSREPLGETFAQNSYPAHQVEGTDLLDLCGLLEFITYGVGNCLVKCLQ